MSFSRKFGLFIGSSLFKLCLVIFATSLALTGVIGSSGSMKSTVSSSGLYDSAVEGILDASKEENPGETRPVVLDRPEVRRAAMDSFEPQTLNSWGDDFIDGIYGWLEGRTTSPEFRIDMSEQKQTFIQKIADSAALRLENLRPCTAQENARLAQQGSDIDLFTLECRPPVDIAAERQRLVDELNGNQDFLGQTVVTGDDMSPDGRLDSSTNSAPQVFRLMRSLPVISAVIGLLAAASMVLLAERRLTGVKKVGKVLFVTGVIMFVSTLVFGYLFARPDGGVGGAIDLPSAAFQAAIIKAVVSLLAAFNLKVIIISAIYALIGGVVLLALHYRRDHIR